MLTGSIVAIVTPMQDDGRLDYPRFKALIDFHIDQGTDGIVVVGTTGESPTVDFDEHKELIRVAVAHAPRPHSHRRRHRRQLHRGGDRARESAKNAGADASLSVVPYYNKPTQEGLYRHFRSIAEAVEIPLILYNVPGRTVADLSNETTLRLAQIPNIIGIKGRDRQRRARLRAAAPRRPRIFAIYSGDDASGLALMLLGFKGIISVTANVAPRLMHEMCAAALSGELNKAREAHFKLLGLHTKLFVEANPIPVKWAVAQLGLIGTGHPPAAYAAFERQELFSDLTRLSRNRTACRTLRAYNASTCATAARPAVDPPCLDGRAGRLSAWRRPAAWPLPDDIVELLPKAA